VGLLEWLGRLFDGRIRRGLFVFGGSRVRVSRDWGYGRILRSSRFLERIGSLCVRLVIRTRILYELEISVRQFNIIRE
jgi:hypothetical protein